jgi:phosphoglycolate phosphatase-like HAD superfamily hydrolase
LDSDGCVLDTMEVKHKECFAPLFVDHFGLHHVQQYAQDAWEFVTLYSRDRGLNRFKALIKAVELLRDRLAGAGNVDGLPDVQPVAQWLEVEPNPSTASLKLFCATNGDHMLHKTLQWSLDADRTIEKQMRNVRPFRGAPDSLAALREAADTLVLSTAPFDTLEREWRENGLTDFVRCIAGQDQGSKESVLAMVAPGRYTLHRTLMVGDAPGDLNAARSIGALFYPIIPGSEEASWSRFDSEGLERFLAGHFAGSYQEALVEDYLSHLPEQVPWKTSVH